MENHNKIEALLKLAKAGDKKAEAEIFQLLLERFQNLATLKLKKDSILRKHINIPEECQKICNLTIQEVKRLYPINSSTWSLIRVMYVFHNILENAIFNLLTTLAKQGNSSAENSLFSRLRIKLIERIETKKRRKFSHESPDK